MSHVPQRSIPYTRDWLWAHVDEINRVISSAVAVEMALRIGTDVRDTIAEDALRAALVSLDGGLFVAEPVRKPDPKAPSISEGRENIDGD